MAKRTFLTGVLYKKTFDSAGNISAKIPFLIKTMASLVINEDGTTVESRLTNLNERLVKIEDAKTYLVYESLGEYQTAYANGEIPEGVLAIVKD